MMISTLLNIRPGITALIGGGGKTGLMYRLAAELSKISSVIICTSTHILVPEQFPLVKGDRDEIRDALKGNKVICVGTPAEKTKLTFPSVSFDELERLADHVIVEADGAKGLPLKAHAPYEPVIPENTVKTVLVIGADGLMRPVKEVCHRPGIWAKLADVTADDPADPVSEAKVIEKEGFGDIIFINKTETEENLKKAEELAGYLKKPTVIGSLKHKEYRKWD